MLAGVVGLFLMSAAPALAAWGWAAAASMSTGRAFPAVALLPDGRVLVAGGWQEGGALASAELYDPVSNTWSPARTMPMPRAGASATLLGNGRVLIVGRGDPSVLLYDPVSDTWSAAAHMSTARTGAAVTVLASGKVLVAGGYDNNGVTLASVELYDPGTNTWSPAAPMSRARSGATATLLRSGKVLVADGDGSTPTLGPATAELYDPSSNRWSSAGTIAASFFYPVATLLLNGEVLAVGSSAPLPSVPIAELYDPVTNTWSQAAAPHIAIGGTVTLLRTGEVLLAGGTGQASGFAPTAELYDPNADAWSDAGSMRPGRVQAAATLLPDGRVLVLGGASTVTGDVLSSADLFTAPAYVPVVPVNTALPSISGALTEGQTLTVVRGIWTNTVTSYRYQWLRCDAAGSDCVPVPGATGLTYALAAVDVGASLRVAEWATNAVGTTSPVSSLATAVVSSRHDQPTKPRLASRPTVSGKPRVGQRLSVSSGAWTGSPAPSFSYQWQRCHSACVNIARRTSSAYRLTSADVGSKVRVLVIATNSAGRGHATSAQVGPIAPSPSQLTALLLGMATPRNPDARISVLLKRGGYTVNFKTFGAGRTALAWYYLPPGAKPNSPTSTPQPVLIARGAARFNKTTLVRLKIALTAAGKRTLGGARRLTLTYQGTYTPAGYSTAVVTKTFKLIR